jgi:hypothetical protein
MTDDEQLLEEYTKEIHGKYYNSAENMTVARLIESHRHLRQLNREWNGAFDEARAQGYKCGYDFGVKQAASDTIQYNDLRKMTIQDLANLIGEEE